MLSQFSVFGVRGIHGNVPKEFRDLSLYEARNYARRFSAPEIFVSNEPGYQNGQEIFLQRVDRLREKGYLYKAEAVRQDLKTCDSIRFKEYN